MVISCDVDRQRVVPRSTARHVGNIDVAAFEFAGRGIDQPVGLALPVERLSVERDDPHLAGFEAAAGR